MPLVSRNDPTTADPISAATMPTTIVSQMGMSCFPGRIKRPSAPMTSPMIKAPRIPSMVTTSAFTQGNSLRKRIFPTARLPNPVDRRSREIRRPSGAARVRNNLGRLLVRLLWTEFGREQCEVVAEIAAHDVPQLVQDLLEDGVEVRSLQR